MIVREASSADLTGILEIYNHVVSNTTAIYDEAPATLADRREWFDARGARGFPVLVADDAGTVVGFSSFGDWRARAGYRFTVEHTVHVRETYRGRGLGRQLVEALFQPARARNVHAMIGGIDAENLGSIGFHERLGFKIIGRFPEVGYKFGRWLDLVCMQRMIE